MTGAIKDIEEDTVVQVLSKYHLCEYVHVLLILKRHGCVCLAYNHIRHMVYT